jgi:tRNA-2-methylthio-N6-dimethylallyladenosine synthase
VEKLCPALHLPFQSGSDAVLKRMSRLYTAADYCRKIDALRKTRSDIALSTDVIVGFPGETEEDFRRTLEVLETVRFSGAFLFKYSPRPGTRAHDYGDEVPEEVKEERLSRAQAIAFGTTWIENEEMIGKTTEVLVESIDKKKLHYTGRNAHNKLVHIYNAGEACVGKILDVEITEATGSNLRGYYVGAPRHRTPETLSTPISIAAN